MHYRLLATITFTTCFIFATVHVHSQGLDVHVRLDNDSTRSGMLQSVNDSTAILQFPEYQWDQRLQSIPLAQIQVIEFTHTEPGNASEFVQILGMTGGVIVGSVAGAAIGDAIIGEPEGFIRTRWGVVGTTVVGATAGYYAGGAIVNPSVDSLIRLDPNVAQHRDSLRAYLQNTR